MFTVSEMIVLLWLLPVGANIILPLAVLCFWSIRRVLHRASRATSAGRADTASQPEGQNLVSAMD